MTNTTMKKVGIAVVVAVISALIMLGIQLQFNGFQLEAVDIQRWVVAQLGLDVTVYLAFKYVGNNKEKAEI